MVASLIIQSLIGLVMIFMLFVLFKQQGRILLRLDSLEGAAGAGSKQEESKLQGLALETAVKDFQLPDLSGKMVSLSDFRGRRVLLSYWSSQCGYCDLAAADLARVQSGLQKNNTELVMVAYGNADSNRKLAAEHGLNCSILLLDDSPEKDAITNAVFEFCGTPSAYLLDEQGRIASPLAVGMDTVVQLARESTKGGEAKKQGIRKLPLSESRIEREGLKAGTPAPAFNLPTVNGNTVSLDEFRGRKVLLVFSDPHCGPCDALAPQLAKLHRKHENNGLAFVMVGRGGAEENKKKVTEYGIKFPVAVQERWKLSKQYGIFATPVAFLIDKDGVILRDVAKGADDIMALAHESLAST